MLLFDDKGTREERKKYDKLAPIRNFELYVKKWEIQKRKDTVYQLLLQLMKKDLEENVVFDNTFPLNPISTELRFLRCQMSKCITPAI